MVRMPLIRTNTELATQKFDVMDASVRGDPGSQAPLFQWSTMRAQPYGGEPWPEKEQVAPRTSWIWWRCCRGGRPWRWRFARMCCCTDCLCSPAEAPFNRARLRPSCIGRWWRALPFMASSLSHCSVSQAHLARSSGVESAPLLSPQLSFIAATQLNTGFPCARSFRFAAKYLCRSNRDLSLPHRACG
jgi:hypothetical protein